MKDLAIALVCSHFVGDWFFQWPNMAANKWKNPKVLLQHVTIVSLTLFVFLAPHLTSATFVAIVGKIVLNAVLHGVIDWNIWRVYNRLCGTDKMGNEVNRLSDFWFWKFIALDQLLHIVILFVLFL
jgi:hypothetical protein